MKTPFDVAANILRRQTDEIQRSISVTADQLNEIRVAQDTLASVLHTERALAADHWDLPSSAYLERLCTAGERLKLDAQRCETKLSSLRDQALESYAALKAVESAAQGFVIEANRAADIAEQARFDDITSTRYARSIRLKRVTDERMLGS